MLLYLSRQHICIGFTRLHPFQLLGHKGCVGNHLRQTGAIFATEAFEALNTGFDVG